MPQISVILHPTDFSEPTEQAHAMACELARKEKAKLIVLHVTAKPVVSVIEKATELPPEELQKKLWETLRCPKDCETGLDVLHRVEEGNPVQQIARIAREVQADLIVMGTHGPRGVLSWFTTNVTDHVVREAPCSVLIVKNRSELVTSESKPA
jgi:universal stress protein A